MKPVLLNSLIASAALVLAAAGTPGLAAQAAGSSAERSAEAAASAANKAVALTLSNSLLGRGDLRELGRHIAPQLVAHDPTMANGRGGLLAAIDTLRRSLPGYTLTVKHVLADRDLVLVHSHLSTTPVNEMSGLNRIDIYRFERGLVAEHWSVRGDAPTSSASGNSAFSNLYQAPAGRAQPSPERVALNRWLATQLSEEVFGKQNFGLLERFWAPGYIQHNPYVGNGRAALAAVIGFISVPGKSYRVTHALAERDLTAVCAHTVDPGRDPRNEFEGTFVCDLYRVDDFQLVEHWDLWQGVPSSTVSGNSMVGTSVPKHGR